MDAQFWLWLDTALMTAGGCAILAIGRQRTPGEQADTVLHGIVCLIAACAYFAMAVGQGVVILPLGAGSDTGRVFYYARYLDWTFTTPLLLAALAYTAMHSGIRRNAMVAGMLLADVMMVLTGLFFAASEVIWVKWAWFGVSSIAFLAVYYVMWGPMLAENRKERPDVQSSYRRNAAVLTVLWLVYPLVIAVSTDGLSLISPAAGVAAIAVIDLVSKVGFGLLSLASTSKLTEEDLNGSSTRRGLSYGTAD